MSDETPETEPAVKLGNFMLFPTESLTTSGNLAPWHVLFAAHLESLPEVKLTRRERLSLWSAEVRHKLARWIDPYDWDCEEW